MHPYLITRKQMKARRQSCPIHPYRLLLVLDGARLTREAVALALDHCSALSQRIDVLVSTPDAESAGMLREFLGCQAEQNVEIRLTITGDPLANQVEHYLRRFPSIKTVVSDDLDRWAGQIESGLERLRKDGYRFISLTQALQPRPPASQSRLPVMLKTDRHHLIRALRP